MIPTVNKKEVLLQQQKIMKDWGYEIVFENDREANYCGKLLVCTNNKFSSGGKFHYHLQKTETFFVISGILLLEKVDSDCKIKSMFLNVGDSFQIKPGVLHRFKSFSQVAKFIEASTYDRPEDSYRIWYDDFLKQEDNNLKDLKTKNSKEEI